MSDPVTLSTVMLDPAGAIRRDPPRPAHLRDARYADQFDWHTLFYDVYRVGPHIVMQGPPLRNLLDALRADPQIGRALRWPFPSARHVARDKRGEVWLKSPADTLEVNSPLGTFSVSVQPNLSHLFAGRRVLHTLSKDNAPRWIIDWIAFYRAIHGADAVLIYDNNSTAYTVPDLERLLRDAFPDMVIKVVSWPFPYGPQGGLAGAVDGVEAPWDSDFCQTGSLQHARFRFLLQARSVLNVDIDELVLSDQGRSIFAATEQSHEQFIRFPGTWISPASPRAITADDCRHADFVYRDSLETEICPPKWCVVPSLNGAYRQTWSVHNLFGSPHNEMLSGEYTYRHMKGITNNWKYDRWESARFDHARFQRDDALVDAFHKAGLG